MQIHKIVSDEDFVNELLFVDGLLEPALEQVLLRGDESGCTAQDAENIRMLKTMFFPEIRRIVLGGPDSRVDENWAVWARAFSAARDKARTADRYAQTRASRETAAYLVDMALWKASMLLKALVSFFEREARAKAAETEGLSD